MAARHHPGLRHLIIFAARQVWDNVKQRLPEADSPSASSAAGGLGRSSIPARTTSWTSADDIVTVDELHVEVDSTYHFLLESRDVIHSFLGPVFSASKQDAIPGRTITGWFEPILTGEHDIQCAEICGIGHGVMAARIHIEDAQQHADWIRSASVAPAQ